MTSERLGSRLELPVPITPKEMRELFYFSSSEEQLRRLPAKNERIALAIAHSVFELEVEQRELIFGVWQEILDLAVANDLILRPTQAMVECFGQVNKKGYFTSEIARGRMPMSTLNTFFPGDIQRSGEQQVGWSPKLLEERILEKFYLDRRANRHREGWHLLVLQGSCLDFGFLTLDQFANGFGKSVSQVKGAMRSLLSSPDFFISLFIGF